MLKNRMNILEKFNLEMYYLAFLLYRIDVPISFRFFVFILLLFITTGGIVLVGAEPAWVKYLLLISTA